MAVDRGNIISIYYANEPLKGDKIDQNYKKALIYFNYTLQMHKILSTYLITTPFPELMKQI